MSASKRKLAAGGYQDSSDSEEEIPSGQTGKKTKNDSYIHTQSSVSSTGVSSGFQFPIMNAPARARSFMPPTPTLSSSQSRSSIQGVTSSQRIDSISTPSYQSSQSSFPRDAVSSEPEEPTPNQEAGKIKRSVVNARSGSLLNTSETTRLRSTINLERRFNEYTESMEEHWRTHKTEFARLEQKLDQSLVLLQQLSPAALTSSLALTCSPAQSIPSASSTPIVALSNILELANPMPTNELRDTVGRVVDGWRQRVGNKKKVSRFTNEEDNSIKDHVRVTFYRMSLISRAKDVVLHPFYEDSNGLPDTLPAAYIDLNTGYCKPCPHWEASLAQQVEWVPTFFQRFRTTIPNDTSARSALLRSLTDEEVLIVLHDAVFKSCQTAWRDRLDTSETMDEQRSHARRRYRANRKSTTRRAYIKSIRQVQGAEFEHLSEAGYASPEESDSEGGLVILRPEHRAQWVNNLFDAIRMAELSKARSRTGSYPSIPPRHIVRVNSPLPRLQRGPGQSKPIIRIALCGISKFWRENDPKFHLSSHLINARASIKPRIEEFLNKHPLIPNDQLTDEFQGRNELQVELQVESQADQGEGIAGAQFDDIPIDPRLKGKGAWSVTPDSNMTSGEHHADAVVIPAAGNDELTESQAPESQNLDAYYSVRGLEMPPPPPLDDGIRPGSTTATTSAPKKRGRPPKGANSDKATFGGQQEAAGEVRDVASAARRHTRRFNTATQSETQDTTLDFGSQQFQEAQEASVSQPKKRGRPPKNK